LAVVSSLVVENGLVGVLGAGVRDEGAGRARELQSGLVQRELLLTVAGLASLSMTYGNLTALVVGGFIVYKSGGVLLRSVDVLLDRAPVGLAEAVHSKRRTLNRAQTVLLPCLLWFFSAV
jgi:hypothetical protein